MHEKNRFFINGSFFLKILKEKQPAVRTTQ